MQRIYLDANATTPVLPEVFDAMVPYLTSGFGNPSSAHESGQRTRSAVEHARGSVAKMLHCAAKEIVFTSGGTESDNLALFGVLQPYLQRNEPAHLITTQIEHHAILYTAQTLEARGIEVTYLAPDADGIVDLAAFEAALKPHTKLVSIMLANNETGAIQPVGKLARIAKAFNPAILIHTDAVQAASKLPLDLTLDLKNIDLLSLSGHKMYAPQGTGILFVRKGVQLTPLFHGGPHERQRRAGTENVPGIVALGQASELAVEYFTGAHTESVVPTETPCPKSVMLTEARAPMNLSSRTEASTPMNLSSRTEASTPMNLSSRPEARTPMNLSSRPEARSLRRSGETCSSPATLSALRDRLETGLLTAIPDTRINGSTTHRAPNTTNIRFAGVDAESLLIALDMQGISASFGAACQSGATEPSHVLLAMGLTPAEARSSLRLSLSRLTTEPEIDRTLEIIPAAVARLRSLR